MRSFPVILAIGVKESTTFNNIFTGVNLLVVLYAVICGAFKANGENWALPPHTSYDTVLRIILGLLL